MHTHPFNGPLSGTTQVSWYWKGKNNLDFTEARDSEWQRHQLGHMQVCISLQTENHTNTPPLSFLQAGCPSYRPTNSVKRKVQICVEARRRCNLPLFDADVIHHNTVGELHLGTENALVSDHTVPDAGLITQHDAGAKHAANDSLTHTQSHSHSTDVTTAVLSHKCMNLSCDIRRRCECLVARCDSVA